jgi:hypothetical protein
MGNNASKPEVMQQHCSCPLLSEEVKVLRSTVGRLRCLYVIHRNELAAVDVILNMRAVRIEKYQQWYLLLQQVLIKHGIRIPHNPYFGSPVVTDDGYGDSDDDS